jgi:uncharacterized UBP type Zn finger protein
MPRHPGTLSKGKDSHSDLEAPAMADTCSHLDQIRVISASAAGCQDCLAVGDTWVELRLCVGCGRVGCCDNSKNTHATRHYQASGHPLMRSYEPGEDWWWCYVDELAFEVEGAEPARAGG